MKGIRLSLFFLFTIFACTACSTVRNVEEVPQVQRKPPAETIQRCPNLTPLDSGSFKDVSLKLNEVSSLYYLCQHKHGELVEWVERGDH